jgi:hypothetical protein
MIWFMDEMNKLQTSTKKIRNASKCCEKPKELDKLIDLGVSGRIILKYLLGK